MKPQLFALLTALAWGVGGYFEKKGLHLGQLSPQIGITLRTAIALIVLGCVSFPEWRMVPQAGTRALVYMVIGGGVVAGSVGMLCFYTAIKGAPLTRVMPIAFTAPLFGALMGLLFGGETLTLKTALGMLLTVGGIILLTVG
jgi:transporter family protein